MSEPYNDLELCEVAMALDTDEETVADAYSIALLVLQDAAAYKRIACRLLATLERERKQKRRGKR